MARIAFVIPPVDENRFSGGVLCLFEYARGLRARGHELFLVPLLPSPYPRWFAGDVGWLPAEVLDWEPPASLRCTQLIALPLEVQCGLYLMYTNEILQRRLPPFEVTVATACTTALPVHLYGTGRKFYFAQHFEPFFIDETDNPAWFEFYARATYELPLQIIANSSWLKTRLRAEVGIDVPLCPNAIDHGLFNGTPKRSPLGKEVKVISYGGRLAPWKGFREMAEGVRLARMRLPERVLRWQVFGSSILPPDNAIAPYEPLGFLNSSKLAEAYRSADILLSASWYESFPLFPLEAMACGLATITTQNGTEEFAAPGLTAEVVPARDPEAIAGSLVRLITDEFHRVSIAQRGWEVCKRFDWESSVARMESIILQTG
jgi:glycosyltransferase involved in cell wall biosynthesis